MDTQSLISQLNQVELLLNQALDSSESYKKASDELFTFLDQNYVVYLSSSSEERNELREIVKTNHEHNLIDLFLLGYIQRAIQKIESSGEKIWLTRRLVVSAIEDCIHDSRDTLQLLAHLFVAAEEKALDPTIEFENFAQVANDKPSMPGAKPMSKIMLEIPIIAHKINDERIKFL